MSDFATLYRTDVTKHIEKKGRFSYLSWPYAVSEFRKNCPNGTWQVRSFGENNQPYCQTDAGCFVEVEVYPDVNGIDGAHPSSQVSFTQIHPVLNHQNKPIKEPNSFDINTSIQRCLVKAIALATGIGLHIYAGEDLPEDPDAAAKKKATETDKKAQENFNEHTLDGWKGLAKRCKSPDELTAWYLDNKGDIAADCGKAAIPAMVAFCKELKTELLKTMAGG